MIVKCDITDCECNKNGECTRDEIHISEFIFDDMNPYGQSISSYCVYKPPRELN